MHMFASLLSVKILMGSASASRWTNKVSWGLICELNLLRMFSVYFQEKIIYKSRIKWVLYYSSGYWTSFGPEHTLCQKKIGKC